MAKIKYGAVVSDARGSVEGVTFSRNRFGGYLRKKGVPRVHMTTYTQPLKSAVGELSGRWSELLTQAQRDAWIALAVANPSIDVFGASHILSGAQLYSRVNLLRRQAGLTILDVAPVDQSVTGLSSLTVSAVAPGTLTVTFGGVVLAAGHRLYLFATPAQSPGKLASKAEARFIGVSGLVQLSPYAAGAQYVQRFGDMPIGKLVSVFAATMRDDRGALSPFLVGRDTA